METSSCCFANDSNKNDYVRAVRVIPHSTNQYLNLNLKDQITKKNSVPIHVSDIYNILNKTGPSYLYYNPPSSFLQV